MKTFANGVMSESSGVPLEHEEWYEQQTKLQAAEAKGKRAGKAPARAEDEDEPEFHGKPLSFFDGKSDEQILKIEGIGPGTLDKIREAQEERDNA